MFRIAAQKWCPATALSLCACLCSACNHLGSHTDPDKPICPKVPTHAGVPDGAVSPPIRSNKLDTPYNTLPPLTREQAKDPSSADIQQAAFPDKTSSERPAPAPAKTGASSAGPRLAPVGTGDDRAVAEAPLVAALKSFMDKKPVEALAFLRQYDKPNQELLLCLLPLAVDVTREPLSRARPERITAIVEQLRGMEQPLRDHMDLAMDKICFCERIKGFGDYKPIGPGHVFVAPRGIIPGELVQVYVELSNLSGIQRGDLYETRVKSSVKIVPAQGVQPAWERSFKDRNGGLILSRAPRHDYFHSCIFNVPHIPPGPYKLVIEVTDVPTGRKASRSLDFRVSTLPAQN